MLCHILALLAVSSVVNGFSPAAVGIRSFVSPEGKACGRQWRVEGVRLFAEDPNIDDNKVVADEPEMVDTEIATERSELKQSLLKFGASYDRGYGATATSRKEVDRIIEKLEKLNPTASASKGITGGDGPAPLQGIWRMVWTTAQDVLTLASSPISTVGSIYQVIEPPIATNIIDFIPRAQALFPPGVAPSTLIRAEVTTRASARSGNPSRVGLVFEAVKIRPVEILGVATDSILPPLSFALPQINIEDLPGVDPANPPGYFDVLYLDDEMLVIKQNAPGGVFALVKAKSYNP